MSYYRSQVRVLRLRNRSSSLVLLIAAALIASVAIIKVQVVEAFMPLRLPKAATLHYSQNQMSRSSLSHTSLGYLRETTTRTTALFAAAVPIRMSTTQERVRKKGGVQTIEKEKEDLGLGEETERKHKLDKDQWWRVILHNDEIHTFDYVTMSISNVVKTVTQKKAYEITMETHKVGKSTVTQSWKAQAEKYCLGLQQCGLTVSVASDSKFEDDGGGDKKNRDG
eukprot:251948_1